MENIFKWTAMPVKDWAGYHNHCLILHLSIHNYNTQSSTGNIHYTLILANSLRSVILFAAGCQVQWIGLIFTVSCRFYFIILYIIKGLNSCKIHVCLLINKLMNRLDCTTALSMNGDIAHRYLLSMKHFVLRVDKLPTRLSGCSGTSRRCLRHHHLHPIDVHVVLLRNSRPQSTFSFFHQPPIVLKVYVRRRRTDQIMSNRK